MNLPTKKDEPCLSFFVWYAEPKIWQEYGKNAAVEGIVDRQQSLGFKAWWW